MKMKKLIAVLLICVMMFTLAVPALGETCYEMLKLYFSATEGRYLGVPQIIPFDFENIDQHLAVMYSGPDSMLLLAGFNSKGEGEVCAWYAVDTTQALGVFYDLCNSWDYAASMCDAGYNLMLTWDYGEEDNLIIDSASEAALFVEALEERLQ